MEHVTDILRSIMIQNFKGNKIDSHMSVDISAFYAKVIFIVPQNVEC